MLDFPASPTLNQEYSVGGKTWVYNNRGWQLKASTAGAGTVLSVGLSMPAGFTVTNSPVVDSDTLSVTFAAGYVSYTTAEAARLAAMEDAATANSADAVLLARANHTGAQAIATITGLSDALDAKLAAAAFTWGNLADKPTTFTPSSHGHAIGDVTGLATALDGKAAVSHNHTTGEITGLDAALSAKLDDSQATAAGLALLGAVDAPAQRSALSLGSAATTESSAYTAATHVGSGDAAHAAATTGAAGFMSAADKTKLDGVTAGATVNSPDEALRRIPNNIQNTNYTYALSDAGGAVHKNNTAAYAHTIPPVASVAFVDGDAITALNDGTSGNLTVTPGSGVTLIKGTTTGAVVLAPGESALLHNIGTNRWRAY